MNNNNPSVGSSSNADKSKDDTSREYEAVQENLKAHVDTDRNMKSQMQELSEKAAKIYLQKQAEELAQPSKASKDQEGK